MAKAIALNGKYGSTALKYPMDAEVEKTSNHTLRNIGISGLIITSLGLGLYEASETNWFKKLFNSKSQTEAVENGVRLPTPEFKLKDYENTINEYIALTTRKIPIASSNIRRIEDIPRNEMKELLNGHLNKRKEFMKALNYQAGYAVRVQVEGKNEWTYFVFEKENGDGTTTLCVHQGGPTSFFANNE